MRRFALLYQKLDASTGTLEKTQALLDYFATVPDADAAWALWLLSGGKVGGAKARIAGPRELRQWVAEAAGLPEWLVDDCYHEVGDLAETLTLLLPEPDGQSPSLPLHVWIEQRLLAAANKDVAVRRAMVMSAWQVLPAPERFILNKLLTGSLRVGVSTGLLHRALAQLTGLDVARISQRLLGNWAPSADAYRRLRSGEALEGDASLPLPFYLASPLEGDLENLGPVEDWIAEWKWDGIRLQLIKRGQTLALWSRGDERLDGRFPEIERAAERLAVDCVIDGELLAWGDGQPLPFTALQTRIQRRKPGAKVLSQAPVRMLAYDLLELNGSDLRAQPLTERRARLDALIAALSEPAIALSPHVPLRAWADAHGARAQARESGVEGLMFKRAESPYQAGRKRGDWWKWKVDPLTVDAVLMYAQPGHGRRSTLYTDYTFGLWHDGQLVPIAKAYSGLDDAEILRLDRWIRANTLERFGPVRSVRPEQVFELGFEAVNHSSRHKSGVAVRFPRMLRWRTDKTAQQADTLATLQAMSLWQEKQPSEVNKRS